MKQEKQFNSRFVQGLKPETGRQIDHWDPSFPGFGVRVSPRGRKTWVIMFRANNQKRRMTLGVVGDMDLSDARKAASKVLEDVEKGFDPAADKIQQRATRPQTFGELADLYMERHAKPNKRTAHDDQLKLNGDVLPAWSGRRLDTIRRADAIHLIEAVHNRGAPTSANRLLALIRKIFNWAMEKDLVETSPVAGVKPMSKERSRDRILDDRELKAVWQAAGNMEWPWNTFFRLLILTAQRRDEVAGMQWSELDMGAKSWTLASERNKSDRGHDVPLSEPAMQIIGDIPEYGSRFVFPANSNPRAETYISGFSKAKGRLDGLSGVTGWTIHDLRRTAASGMARLGIAPHVVEKVLNHTSGQISGVAAVYNRYGYDDEKRRALEAWGQHVVGLEEVKPGNVVALK